jgi:hypothetical protein
MAVGLQPWSQSMPSVFTGARQGLYGPQCFASLFCQISRSGIIVAMTSVVVKHCRCRWRGSFFPIDANSRGFGGKVVELV